MQKQKSRLAVLMREPLFREPRLRLNEVAQRLDATAEALRNAAAEQIRRERERIASLRAVLRQHRPDQLLAMRRQQHAALHARLTESFRGVLRRRREYLAQLLQMLRVLSPQATLDRGYTITTSETGALLDSIEKVAPGMKLRTRFRDGTRTSVAAED
jgi:exodeoxyribonuclease VII large subunit